MGALVSFDIIKLAKKKLEGSDCRSLVIGASGGIGSVLLQMLKKYKGHITAVCSKDNAENCIKMGANEVVNYADKSFSEELAQKGKFDVIFDLVGGKEIEAQSKLLLKKGAMYVTAVGNNQYMAMDRVLSFGEFCSSLCGLLSRSMCGCFSPYQYVMSQGAYPPMKKEIWKSSVVESGARALIAEEVPFREVPLRQAMTRVFSHHAGGRVVINLEKRGESDSATV